MTRVRKAVFPVAGLGTRFLPATKAMPKEMLTVVDKPVLQYAVEEARAAGIEHFIFVASRGKTSMEDHFDRAPELEDTLRRRGKDAELEAAMGAVIPSSDLTIVRQQEPLGLGHAVWCARNVIGDEPFAVLLPDEALMSDPPCLATLIETHVKLGRSHVLAVQDVPREQTSRYGILDPEEVLEGGVIRAKGMVEKPKPEDAPSTAAAIGRYVLDPVVFEHLDKGVKGQGQEIQLTDAIFATMGTAPLHGVPFTGTRYDCGDKLGFLKANIAYAMQRPDLAEGLRAFMDEIART